LLLVALALLGPALGLMCGVGEAGLVELAPDRAERNLTRWTLLGWIGDIAAPALLAGAVALGGDFRAALLAIAVATIAAALAVPRLPRRAGHAQVEEPALPWRTRLGSALANRRLLAWTAGVFLCSLLDEIFIAFAALHIAERFGADPSARVLVLGAFLVGGAIGLVTLERVLAGVDPRRLLAALSATCAAALLAWIAAPNLAASAALAGLVGLTAGGHYPLAKAQAYRAAPGSAGTVGALDALLNPLDMALPLGLAAVAGWLGVTAVLVILAAQPLGLLGLALLGPAAPRRPSSAG
jgi:MFS family permease